MKKIISLIVATAFVAGTTSAQKIKGSDTVLPISQKEAEGYGKKNPSSKLTVMGGGSGVGIAALLDGSTDIAMSSRKMKMEEKIKMNEAGKAFKEATIAFDALTIIVNPANNISQLTREQLEKIFTGKITNWKEVGGDDLKIIAYSRESSSGTFEFFKEHVMKNKNYASSVLLMPATGAIVQSISQTKGAIGYIGLAYMNKSVKDIKVSYDGGKTFVAASLENAKAKTYPITRPLYYYYATKDEAKVKPFIDYVLSADGQTIISQVGYVPLK
jgi:phosphate transport system substrate-binding protein